MGGGEKKGKKQQSESVKTAQDHRTVFSVSVKGGNKIRL